MGFDDEFNYAISLLNEDLYNDNRYFSKCIMLTRYWITIGKDSDYIRTELYTRLKKIYCDFGNSIILSDMDNIIKIATIKGELEKKEIYFSSEELDYIHSFNQLGFEKFLFIMFCLYKVNNNYQFSIGHREIMGLSKNSYNKKYCNSLFHKAYVNNIFDMKPVHNVLKYYPTDNTLSLYNENNIVMHINNFKNIIYYYLEYIDVGNYIRCKKCGCIEEKISKKKEYCSECAIESQKERNREYMRRIRGVDKCQY